MINGFESKDWTTCSEGARLLCVAKATFPKCAEALGIRWREIPGRMGRLYYRPELEAAIARLQAEVAARAQSLPLAQTIPNQ